MNKKEKIIPIILICASVLIIALHFIPWMKYRYVLMGYDDLGNEIYTTFTEWWSPFYQMVILNSSPFYFRYLFFICLTPSIATIILNLISLIKKKYSPLLFITIGVTVLTFVILLFVLMVFRPTR